MRRWVRQLVPIGLAALVARGPGRRWRAGALAGLLAFWAATYARYRREGRIETNREFELLRSANWAAFTRHYNEEVPTIEEEFALWGDFHQHRHEMRYDLVANSVRAHLPHGGRILDVGCGAGLVAERLLDQRAEYVGVEFGGHQLAYARAKFEAGNSALTTTFVRAAAERMPFTEASFDVVVMSEVIEHLMRPELAVWEVARVLRPGGVFVMTTNNASEMPLRSPLSHPLAWIEKALGATHPHLISRRPWVWPVALGEPGVYLPHTHHIYGETKAMLFSAGLETMEYRTFEFPPPQSALAARLEARGDAGKAAVDVIEWAATRTPGLRRLGCHLFMVARRRTGPVPAAPPEGVWPGPHSR